LVTSCHVIARFWIINDPLSHSFVGLEGFGFLTCAGVTVISSARF
jgi:hypothetical protein